MKIVLTGGGPLDGTEQEHDANVTRIEVPAAGRQHFVREGEAIPTEAPRVERYERTDEQDARGRRVFRFKGASG